MREGNQESDNCIRNAILNKDGSQISAVVEAVKQSGGLEYTQELAKREAELAEQALATLEDSNYKQALLDLAKFAITRSY